MIATLMIGVVILAIHHVVSTELLERETKKFVYEFIQVLQEDNYDELASMMISEERNAVSPTEASLIETMKQQGIPCTEQTIEYVYMRGIQAEKERKAQENAQA